MNQWPLISSRTRLATDEHVEDRESAVVGIVCHQLKNRRRRAGRVQTEPQHR